MSVARAAPSRTGPHRGPNGRDRRGPLRAVVTDVDGTLTDARRHLDPVALEWVRRLEASGFPVVLATGNVLPIALALHRFLGLSGPIVAENGGIICSWRSGREHVERRADRSVAERAFRALRRSGLPVRRLFTDRWRESEVALEPTVSVGAIRRCLGAAPVRVESTGFALHLMEVGAGKLPALERALKPLGLDPSACVVLGDGDNDVEMLRAAGFGVSFPSASRRARTAARYVTRARFGRGFVEGLKASHILG
ncbi:MAG: phosphoglycolate phosphatase [Thermoplasmata archaeon]